MPSQETSQIAALTAIIDVQNDTNIHLANDLEVARKYSTLRLANIDTLAEKIHKAEQLAIDWVDDGAYFDDDAFAELAAIFDWDVTKEIDVTVTATFRGAVTVPRGFNDDDLNEKFRVSCDPCDNIEGYLDCDEIRVEVRQS